MDEFWNGHSHTDYSALDGITKISEQFEYVKELGQVSLGISDHGTIAGTYEFLTTGKKYGIKTTPGIEAYVDDIFSPRGDKDRTYYHCCIWATDYDGLADLVKLSTAAWRYNYYYKPRLNNEMIESLGSRLIATSGCVSGQFAKLILAGDNDGAEQFVEYMRCHFGRFYMEIQAAVPIVGQGEEVYEHQRIVNRAAIQYADQLGIPLLATNDSHYLRRDDAEAHNVWLALQSRRTMDDPKRFKFDVTEVHHRTRQEMEEAFTKWYPEIDGKYISTSLDNTVEIGSSSTVNGYKTFTSLTPKLLPEEQAFARLCELAAEGYQKLITPESYRLYAERKEISIAEAEQVYKTRFSYELSQIRKQGFVDYFLLVHDLLNWCEENGIYRGAARGSAASSLISYLVGITKVIDPLEHDLIFERFIAPDRIYSPDIDLDFAAAQRDKVVNYISERWGIKNVSHIGTQVKEKGKLVIQDIGRAYKLPSNDINRVKSVVIQRATGDARASDTLQETFTLFAEAREFDAKYPWVFPMATRLEGCVRGYGSHAAGILITPDKLENYVPIEQRGGVLTSAFDGLAIEKMGFLKLDILGIDVLDLLRSIHDMVLTTRGVDIDYWHLGLTDKPTLDAFAKGDLLGVFQFQKSLGMENICRAAPIDRFEDIVHLNSLYRPGGMRSGAAKDYLDHRSGRKRIPAIHPIYDEITSHTYGIIIYQEQVMQMFSRLAGFPATRVDEGRKLISKSHGVEAFDRLYPEFRDGCLKNGIDEKMSYEFFTKIRHTGSYAFNKCVSGDTVLEDGRTIKEWYEKPGLNLSSMDLEGNLVYNRVLNIFSTGYKPTIRLYWNDGFLDCTREHKIFTSRGWIKAGNLREGDLIYAEAKGIQAERSRIGDSSSECSERSEEGERAVERSRIKGANGTEDFRIAKEKMGREKSRTAVRDFEENYFQCGSERRDITASEKVAQRESELGRLSYEENAYTSPRIMEKCCSQDEVEMGERSRISSFYDRKANEEVQGFDYISELGEGWLCRMWPLVPEPIRDRSAQLSRGLLSLGRNADSRFNSILRYSFAESDDRIGWNEERGDFFPREVSEFTTEAAGDQKNRLGFISIERIEDSGYRETFDIEMERPYNSYLANGIVVHNSHAVAYSLLSYYSQYMKVHYPQEFFTCFFNGEEDEELIKQAVRYWINNYGGFLPLDINRSQYNFSVDGDNIRAGFAKLKWCSPAATAAIVKARPFTNYDDFVDRVEKRVCNARVKKNLLIAGAFDDLIGVENVLPLIEMTERQREIESAEIYPSFSGANKLDAYEDVVEKIQERVKLIPIAKLRSGHKGLFQTVGFISETRFNRVGDFDKESKSDAEKELIFKQHGWKWGSRFVDFDLDDGFEHVRLRVNPDFFEEYGEYFRNGKVLLVRGSYWSKEGEMGGIGIVTGVEELDAIRLGTPTTPFGAAILSGTYFVQSRRLQPITEADAWGEYWGVLTGWKNYLRKKDGKRYGILTFQVGNKSRDAVLWADDYERLGEKLRREALIKMKVRYGDTAFFNTHLSVQSLEVIK